MGKIIKLAFILLAAFPEIGSLVFAILNVVGTGLATAVSSFYLVYFVALGGISAADNDIVGSVLTILAVAWLSAALSFAFSIVLLIGLNKKKSEYVKAYFVYGVVVELVCFAVAMYFFFFPRNDYLDYSISDRYDMGMELIGACMIYSTILGVIWARYKMLKEEEQYAYTGLLEPKTVC